MAENVIPMPPQELTWTFDDYVNRKCMLSEVGQIRYDMGYAARLARLHTVTAVQALIDVATQDKDLAAKAKAAQMLLDRGYGKAVQTVEQSGQVVVKVEWASADRLSYNRPAAEVVEMTPVEAIPWKEGRESTDPEDRFVKAMDDLNKPKP